MYTTSEILEGDEYRDITIGFIMDHGEVEITEIKFEDDGENVPNTLYTEDELQGWYDSCHYASYDDWTSGM